MLGGCQDRARRIGQRLLISEVRIQHVELPYLAIGPPLQIAVAGILQIGVCDVRLARIEPNIVSYDPRPRSSDRRVRQIRRLLAVARRRARLPRLAEGRNDMLGEELDLAHLFVERHEALVEEPAEPFELTVATNLVQGLNLALHLIDRAG
jgi:hypothetical protein